MLQHRFMLPVLVLFILGTIIPAEAKTQPRVTFQVNIEHEVKNGFFNHDRHELRIRSRNYTLSPTGYLTMKRSKEDSLVYAVTVNFPQDMVDKEFYYQFVIVSNNRVIKEDYERYVLITEQPLEMNTTSFYHLAF